ncbi:polysaccharide biosynthesis/export family protein [Carnimonas nigrificans]|uniref:polysaccharide biosynthesis/export family protein n=1 Tax=Carnimonas nigrificans TaxID=64323 RepID=UPI000551336B|nr:polysaccharide biosynthesis/export family protein [Carnimonas nigrificans]
MSQFKFWLRASGLVAVACLNYAPLHAQEVGGYDGNMDQQQGGGTYADPQQSGGASYGSQQQNGAASGNGQVDDSPRANWNDSNYGPVPNAQNPAQRAQYANVAANTASKNSGPTDPDLLPPFGGNLFNGGFRSKASDGLNPGYTVKPGDQITLRVWGAVEFNQTLTVDPKGNVFLPGVGPIQVQGTSASALNGTVTSAIRQIYPQQVQVYTNLQGVQPVGVFVTGNVQNPGRYAGTPADSILYFLDQAGGIDNGLGSYRNILVKRQGRVIQRVDLYDFLTNGDLPEVQFREGDTIVVSNRGPAVAVTGDVQRPFRYELKNGESLSGDMVTSLSRLEPGVSNVLLRGQRDNGPMANYMPLSQFADARIQTGDEVLFSADKRSETIVVQLQGSFYGPKRYAVPRNARLGELLNAISVPQDMTSIKDVSVIRQSVKEQQEIALKDSLDRLQQTYLGYPSRTSKEADIQLQQAQLIERFVAQARKTEPSGRLVVARGNGIADIRLQDGDIIDIPESNDSILLSGEVTVPQAAVYTEGMNALDYIEQAGGFSPRADKGQVLVVHRNGQVVRADQTDVRSGDQILVLPKPPTSNIELASSITQIMYNIAVSTAAVLRI